jgi:hypothetical protein
MILWHVYVSNAVPPPMRAQQNGNDQASHGCRGCAREGREREKKTGHAEATAYAKWAPWNPDQQIASRGSEDLASIAFGVGPV